jgi:hypothetical protein
MACLRHEAQKLVLQNMKQACQLSRHKTWCYLRRNGGSYSTRILRCSSQLSLVTFRRWVILWYHSFDVTAFLVFLSDRGLRVHDGAHLSWVCDSNTYNYYCTHCPDPKRFGRWFFFCHHVAYNRVYSVRPIRKS